MYNIFQNKFSITSLHKVLERGFWNAWDMFQRVFEVSYFLHFFIYDCKIQKLVVKHSIQTYNFKF